MTPSGTSTASWLAARVPLRSRMCRSAAYPGPSALEYHLAGVLRLGTCSLQGLFLKFAVHKGCCLGPAMKHGTDRHAGLRNISGMHLRQLITNMRW